MLCPRFTSIYPTRLILMPTSAQDEKRKRVDSSESRDIQSLCRYVLFIPIDIIRTFVKYDAALAQR